MNRPLAAALKAIVILGAAISTPLPAVAGCWTCWDDVADGAYVCVGVNVGQDGWTSCEPQWYADGVWCKFSGGFGSCTGGGCPGCYRFPAIVVGRKSPPLTTQVLLFDLQGTGVQPATLQLAAPGGMIAADVERQIHAATGSHPRLAGYAAESGNSWTSTRFLDGAGSGVVLCARPTGGTFTLSLYKQTQGSAAVIVRRMRCGVDEAALFPVEIDGRQCLAVVHSIASAGTPEEVRVTQERLRGEFTAAAEICPGKTWMPIRVDSPRALDIGVDAWAIRAVVDDALAVGMQR